MLTEVPHRRDPALSFFIEQPGRDRCGSIGDESQIVGVLSKFIDFGDGVEIALLVPSKFGRASYVQ